MLQKPRPLGVPRWAVAAALAVALVVTVGAVSSTTTAEAQQTNPA